MKKKPKDNDKPDVTPAKEPGKNPPKKKAGRPSKAESIKRHATILELILQGWPTALICRFVSEKTDWNITRRSIERYITKCNAEIQTSATWKKELEIGKAIAQLDDLYRRCYKISDFKTALQVRREKTALLSLQKQIISETNKGAILEYIDELKQTAE